MAHAIRGKAVVFGSPGTITVGSAIVVLNQSADFTANHQVDEVVDADNEPVALAHSKEYIDVTITFIPVSAASSGETNTFASAKLGMKKPDKGALVVLTGFNAPANSPAGTDWINGSYSYVGGFKVSQRNNGVTSCDMNIRRAAVNDITGTPS